MAAAGKTEALSQNKISRIRKSYWLLLQHRCEKKKRLKKLKNFKQLKEFTNLKREKDGILKKISDKRKNKSKNKNKVLTKETSWNIIKTTEEKKTN